MTDKEWYAQLSTLVIKGIDLLKEDNSKQSVYENQYDIRHFISRNELPNERWARKVNAIKSNIAQMLKYAGYIASAAFLIIDMIVWCEFLLGEGSLSGALIPLCITVILFCAGLAGQIWEDILL